MENIGTGFNITNIGDFNFIFKPSDNFKGLSKGDIEKISKNIDNMKDRFIQYCEEEINMVNKPTKLNENWVKIPTWQCALCSKKETDNCEYIEIENKKCKNYD